MEIEKVVIEKKFAKKFLTMYENYKKIFTVRQYDIAVKHNMKNNTLTNCLRKLRQSLGLISGHRTTSRKFLKTTYNKLLNMYHMMQTELIDKKLKILRTHTKTSLTPKVYARKSNTEIIKKSSDKAPDKKEKSIVINKISTLLSSTYFTYDEVYAILGIVSEKHSNKEKEFMFTRKLNDINYAIKVLDKNNNAKFTINLLKDIRNKLALGGFDKCKTVDVLNDNEKEAKC